MINGPIRIPIHFLKFLHVAGIMLCSFIAPAQSSGDFFTVEGEVSMPLKLTFQHLSGMRQTEIKAKDRGGVEHIYRGVPLHKILDSAGVGLGHQLRGEQLAKYILIRSADGYEVIFSLPEIDPEFTGQSVLLACQVDGQYLPKGEGPFRMVVPQDKRHSRWIREVREIKIVFSKE